MAASIESYRHNAVMVKVKNQVSGSHMGRGKAVHHGNPHFIRQISRRKGYDGGTGAGNGGSIGACPLRISDDVDAPGMSPSL